MCLKSCVLLMLTTDSTPLYWLYRNRRDSNLPSACVPPLVWWSSVVERNTFPVCHVMHILSGCMSALTPSSSVQRVVRLPLPRADQDRVRQLDVLPPGATHRKQEGADGREPREPGGGGDGCRQGPDHPGCISQLHGSAKASHLLCVNIRAPFLPTLDRQLSLVITQGGRTALS